MSTVASGSALAVALSLMSMADTGRPSRRPERVLSLEPGPPGNHSGGGNALSPLEPPASDQPPKAPEVPTPSPTEANTAQGAPARFAASVRPGSDAPVVGAEQPPDDEPNATTTTVPQNATSPTTRPRIQLPGGGNSLGVVPRGPRTPRAPSLPDIDIPDLPHIPGIPGLHAPHKPSKPNTPNAPHKPYRPHPPHPPQLPRRLPDPPALVDESGCMPEFGRRDDDHDGAVGLRMDRNVWRENRSEEREEERAADYEMGGDRVAGLRVSAL